MWDLPASIGNYYGVPTSVIQSLMPKLKITRPYGIAGHLDWMERATEVHGYEMGLEAAQLANSAEMIRTFTQGVADEQITRHISDQISGAERIIFLGFAFHPQNMAILRTKVGLKTEILATSHGTSENDRHVIKESILNTFGFRSEAGTSIIVAPEKCNELFQNYWRTITAPPVRRLRSGIGATVL